jgi:threonylcarbamoyladenosine tRNA methylthiotransferase MtaB
MRIYLDQVGCRLNYSEMESLAHELRAAGHTTVSAPEQAHVVVFNSCAVTRAASRKSRQRIHQLHRANPGARIVATGCWATLSPEKARALPGVEMVAVNPQKDLLAALLEPWSADLEDPTDLLRMQPDGTPFESMALAERHGRTRAFVKVQDGCDNRCTFCVVTLARGESRSRPLQDVVDEVRRLADEGVQEAVLTGVHLGSYGRDLNSSQTTDLRQLAEAILSDSDIRRLRLSSLEPWELAEGFFDLWARWPQRLCPHLHLPLQAGTDRQLRAMARRCTVDSYRRLVQQAREAIPDLVVTTDLIVGFPGETDDDFEAGLEFVEEMRFAHAHIFPFSQRPGTAAVSFGSRVLSEVKQERSRRTHAVIARTGRAERMRFVGTRRSVLWEGQGQELQDSEAYLWSGLTDNYLRVMAEATSPDALHNVVTCARLDALHGDSFAGTVEMSPDAHGGRPRLAQN